MSETILRLERVSRTYGGGGRLVRRSGVRAVAGVDLDVGGGEVVALVGESGSGKSTLGRIAVLLERPDAGRVLFRGEDLLRHRGADLRRRRRDLQVVFQDPLASLNPRWSIRRSLEHPFRIHGIRPDGGMERGVRDLLELVDLPAAIADRSPFQLSGGQRQRVCIARAVALRPALVVADEPTSGLDVSTQALIVALLDRIRREAGTAMLFISHDLRLVRHLAARVAVMRGGEIVERGPAADVFERPRHEYTRQLIASVPRRRFRAPTR